ncbi:hypothetical protein T484DRAFT_1831018 [Baffinella frigidus]|nr:hypothetical protein T484DRAFT_1831018 [Cryptophyta sp. CCMP2293]
MWRVEGARAHGGLPEQKCCLRKCCLRAFATRQLMAALPLGNIAGEELRVTLQEPLEASSQLLREKSVGVLRVTLQEPLEASSQLLREQSVGVATKSVAGRFKLQLNNLHFAAACAKRLLDLVSSNVVCTSKSFQYELVAGLFKLQLNNLHFAAACAKRLLGLVSHSFAASFPQAGGAMGALTLELEDIHKSFSGLLHESVVLLCTCTSPDIVGHVERLLSKASLDASSADMVLPEAVSSPAPKSGGLFASFVKGRGAGAPGSPAKTRSSGQGGDALVARVRRAVQEILSSLRETSPPAVFRLILEETLKGVAAAMEKGVLAHA